MTFVRLAEAYDVYYSSQVNEVADATNECLIAQIVAILRTNFPATMDEYWALNDELFRIRQRFVGRSNPANVREFLTTGSTRGSPRRYRFGPHADLWIRAIWDLTRLPFGKRTIVKLDPVVHLDAPLQLSATPGDIYQFVISCGSLHKGLISSLIGVLESLLSENDAVSLISVPDTFLYLNCQAEFQAFAVRNRHRLNLMSQHWEAFYPRRDLESCGVHFNDVLGDWTTGLNYHTCRKGFRHTYPTFAISGNERINLLNLMPTPELGPGMKEDLFEAISISKCTCGRNRLNFRFIPHQPTAIRPPTGGILFDLELAERLTSSFLNLQFIQEDDKLLIRYRVEGEMRDRELLENYFESFGFKVLWQPDDFYMVGNKRPVFYRFPG